MADKSERLKEARAARGYPNAAAAARAFGWHYSTYAGHENGSRDFSAEQSERYAKAFGVLPEWLLFGSGEQTPQIVENDAPAPDGSALVPVYDIAASAGDGAVVIAEQVSHTLAFPPDYLRKITSSHPRHLAIISVKGDSMLPTLKDDDIVMLDTSKTNLGYEGLFVVRIYDVLHVKRLSHARPGYIEVISDNRSMYPPREYPLADVEVVGKVLWSGGKI